MANKDNISHLSKYQMRILYYKCKEGATHAEIAAYLGRDVNTVQYHMTKIYTVLEIRKDGKSREEMESELKHEICPIIRTMFSTYDDVKIWAPVIKGRLQDEKEDPGEAMDEPVLEESQPPYIPPPSVQKILDSPEHRPINPEILEPRLRVLAPSCFNFSIAEVSVRPVGLLIVRIIASSAERFQKVFSASA